MADEKTRKELDCIELIGENFQERAKSFGAIVKLRSSHGGISGSARETMWAELLRDVLPQKFSLVQNVILIDSEGRHSREVDVAAIDEQYTPYVFRCGEVKFVPIEAVALVMECKSSAAGEEAIEKWRDSIAALCPSAYGIARMATGHFIGRNNNMQKATRPIRVFAALHKPYSDFSAFFDILLHVGDDGLNVKIPNEGKSLAWWGNVLNNKMDERSADDTSLKFKSFPEEAHDVASLMRLKKTGDVQECTATLEDLKVDGNHLLSLNLQLNQLLMLINNPMLFPHFAYAKVFRDKLGKKLAGS